MLEQVERLIDELNKIDRQFFVDYFETGKVKKNQPQTYLCQGAD